jgi:signal transduction histidine kinase
MDHWTASLVHDLRNPLAAICGSAEMLLAANLAPADTMRVTSNIHRAARRMGDLLAEFARFTRGHAEAIERCNLRAILVASCEAAGLAERDGIELLLDVPPQIEIPLARARMDRVFLNLIANALEAMPAGGAIRITASEVGDAVLIEVEDTGPGIPVEIRHRLFEPFVTSGKKQGLGLGLTLSRQTVRDHGGDLWTEPAAGARFVMSLPLRSPSAKR